MLCLPLLFVFVGFARAALNSTCSAGGTPGVYMVKADCISAGGKAHTKSCNSDHDKVVCCTKTSCGSGGGCRFTSTCASGNTVSGLCPGPSDFKCCLPASSAPSSSSPTSSSFTLTSKSYPSPSSPSTSKSSLSTTSPPKPSPTKSAPPKPSPPPLSCKIPPVNTATVNLVKEFEGFVTKPSPDPINLPTVGYGHLCKQKNCVEVPYSFPLTQAHAAALLQTDIKTFTKCVSDYIANSVRLNSNQYGALASWALNVGCGNIKSSTLIRRLNAKENPNTVAAQELPKWHLAGGNSLPGLVRRRAAEVVLFKTASSVISHPPPC